MSNYPKCIRCGYCCLTCLCGHGEYADNEDYVCKYLTINEDYTTTCELIKAGKALDLLGSGCFIRSVPIHYIILEKVNNLIEFKKRLYDARMEKVVEGAGRSLRLH